MLFPSTACLVQNKIGATCASFDIAAACSGFTYGLGIANAYAAYKTGVKYFESSFAGLGGCPFTAVAAGNIATEDLVHLFQQMSLRNDIKLENLIAISKEAAEYFKRELPGTIYKTGRIQ